MSVAQARRSPAAWTFLILLASYADFWHGRDWNSASRLMLAYAVVDRGTVSIDGYEDQTGDKAYFRGHFYSDKLPGFPLLAVAPYAAAKTLFGLPAHPVGARGFAHWPADYWVTLGTSGVLTALAGALLARLAVAIGCGPRAGAMIGLAYGLATPAYVYATMSYGHQASAFCLLAAFALLWGLEPRHEAGGAPSRMEMPVVGATTRARTAPMIAAGFLASYASAIELQVGPVSAILGLYLLAQVIGRIRPPAALGAFAVGAAIPAIVLMGYNILAFGSPTDMGYFHHATAPFAKVHGAGNPLGLVRPDGTLAAELLWGRTRGLVRTAPIAVLTLPGLVALAMRRRPGMAAVSASAIAAIFAVNLSYPEWTGGWSTGPRLLVPLLPFAMLGAAGLVAAGGRIAFGVALALAVAGAVVVGLYQGVGARIPQFVPDPLLDAVLPLWRGDPLPGWATGGRFSRNLASILTPGWVARLPPWLGGVQFAPLVLSQIAAIALMSRAVDAPITPPKG